MARPREFDLDEALENAMEQFWLHGYEATSVNELLETLGIHKGSLYKAFGDKHSLYLATLERYLSGVRDDTRSAFEEAKTARQALSSWVRATALRCAGAEGARKGCFGVNAIVELAPHDEGVRALTRTHTARVEALVADVIRRGQREGEFHKGRDARTLAKYVVTVVFGLYVKGKVSKLSREHAQELVELVLSTLE